MTEIKCPHCPDRPPFSKEANLKRHSIYAPKRIPMSISRLFRNFSE